ncbi:MAG: hypothetical protein QOK23_3718 [Gammaproteobacteria bacterium]|jgi:hypothetical protein|nr:hypothetical protein [Gammaproteobacteria bacterium]MEA3141549.1 hypothetical protein [Gammaproteobacteria bacterium]
MRLSVLADTMNQVVGTKPALILQQTMLMVQSGYACDAGGNARPLSTVRGNWLPL